MTDLNTDIFIADKIFRTRLINARKGTRITQKEMAEISGLSTSSISNLESENTQPSLNTIIRYLHSIGYELTIQKSTGYVRPIIYINR